MKNNEFKKAFNSIHLDDSLKANMLKNINKKVIEETLDKTKLNETYLNNNNFKNKRGIFMNFKKSSIALVSCSALVGGFIIYNSNNNLETNIQPPAPSSPVVGQEYTIEKEFSEFDINSIKNSVSKVEIRNHTNDSTFVDVLNKDVIDKLIYNIENTNEKDMSDKVYEGIASSQADGYSVTLRFILNDDSYYSLRVNLDLDVVCINEAYYDISSEFSNILYSELSNIKDFNKLNSPAPGM